MRIRNIVRIVLFLSVALLLVGLAGTKSTFHAAAHAYAQGQSSESHCRAVAGTVMTNFGAFGADNPNTTLGTATGDLRGAVSGTLVGAPVASGNTVVFHVQHHWVRNGRCSVLSTSHSHNGSDRTRLVRHPCLSRTPRRRNWQVRGSHRGFHQHRRS